MSPKWYHVALPALAAVQIGCEYASPVPADSEGPGGLPPAECMGSNAECRDSDGDGVANIDDVCPDAVDREQLDSDGDGVGDACECLDVECDDPGSSCMLPAVCERETGECVSVRLADGTPCNDGDLCSEFDTCEGGECQAGEPISCSDIEASDSCHAPECEPATGTCEQVVKQGCALVEVRVVRDDGSPVANAAVRSWEDDTELYPRFITDSDGIADVVRPLGSYKFSAVVNGLPTEFSAASCTLPACQEVELRFNSSSVYRALTFDPSREPLHTGGRLLETAANLVRGELYTESTFVVDFDLPSAYAAVAHDHVGSACMGLPLSCGNASNAENQHAYSAEVTGLTGFYLELASGREFDLYTLDYRIRSNDGTDEHLQQIASFPPNVTDILIAPVAFGTNPVVPLTLAAYDRIEVGSFEEERRFSTLDVSSYKNLRGVFFSSTWNVSFDDIVVIPHD